MPTCGLDSSFHHSPCDPWLKGQLIGLCQYRKHHFCTVHPQHTCIAFLNVMRVWNDAKCWNSDSASSNIGFFSRVPRARFRSTTALTNNFSGMLFCWAELRPAVGCDAAAPCTRLDSSNSITPVSKRTALFVGVVAVIWMPCTCCIHHHLSGAVPNNQDYSTHCICCNTFKKHWQSKCWMLKILPWQE